MIHTVHSFFLGEVLDLPTNNFVNMTNDMSTASTIAQASLLVNSFYGDLNSQPFENTDEQQQYQNRLLNNNNPTNNYGNRFAPY